MKTGIKVFGVLNPTGCFLGPRLSSSPSGRSLRPKPGTHNSGEASNSTGVHLDPDIFATSSGCHLFLARTARLFPALFVLHGWLRG